MAERAEFRTDRVRYLVVPEDEVLELLELPPVVRVRRLGLPAGAAVLRAFHDPYRKGFVFLVAHESFDPVPYSDRPPTHPREVADGAAQGQGGGG